MSEPKLFRYDTHVHTSEVSKCARSSGREMAETYHKLGYDGIIIMQQKSQSYSQS